MFFQVFFGLPLEVTDPLFVVSYLPGIILSVFLITTVYGVNPRRQSNMMFLGGTNEYFPAT